MKPWTVGEVVAIIGLIVNGAAIVWGAAKMASSIEHLRGTVGEVKEVVMGVQEITHNLIARISVVEDRVGIPQRRITDLGFGKHG